MSFEQRASCTLRLNKATVKLKNVKYGKINLTKKLEVNVNKFFLIGGLYKISIQKIDRTAEKSPFTINEWIKWNMNTFYVVECKLIVQQNIHMLYKYEIFNPLLLLTF